MTRMAGMPQITDFLNESPNYSAMGGQSIKDAAMFNSTQIKNASDIRRAEDRAEAQIEAGQVWADSYSTRAANQRQSQLFGDITGAIGTIGGGFLSGGFNQTAQPNSLDFSTSLNVGNPGRMDGWNVATNGGGSWGQYGTW